MKLPGRRLGFSRAGGGEHDASKVVSSQLCPLTPPIPLWRDGTRPCPAGEEAVEELLQELKKKIVEELDLKDVTPNELADDTLFFDGGLGLDSVDLMVLVALVDRDYGVEIFSRELGEKVFITLSTLAEYIMKHRKKE